MAFLGAADNSDELLAKIKEAYFTLLREHGAGIVSIKDFELLLKVGQKDATSGPKNVMGYFLLSQEGSSERAQFAEGLRLLGEAVVERYTDHEKLSAELSGLLETLIKEVTSAQKQKTRTIEERQSPEAWRVVDTLTNGVKVWQNKELGILVTDVLEWKYMHQKAAELCASLESPKNFPGLKWTLPSGYPKNLNGQEGFLNLDSDFVSLENSGIRMLLLKMKDLLFWSSSFDLKYRGCAHYFNGNDGYIGYHYRYKGKFSVLCIAR